MMYVGVGVTEVDWPGNEDMTGWTWWRFCPDCLMTNLTGGSLVGGDG